MLFYALVQILDLLELCDVPSSVSWHRETCLEDFKLATELSIFKAASLLTERLFVEPKQT